MMKCPKCGTEAEPSSKLQFLEYTYADNLRTMHAQYPKASMENLIQMANQEFKGCPKDDDKNPCKDALTPITTHLLNVPNVLAIGLVWSTPNPLVQDIMKTLEIIQSEIKLSELFTEAKTKKQNKATYRLRGMICYYGKHYNAYFYNEELAQWIVFDDACVKQVGSTWQHVYNRCRLGHFHPSVLFYELNPSLEESMVNSKMTESQLAQSYFSVSCIADDVQMNDYVDTNLNNETKQPTHNITSMPDISNLHIGGKNVSNGIPAGYKLIAVPSQQNTKTLPGFIPF